MYASNFEFDLYLKIILYKYISVIITNIRCILLLKNMEENLK